MATHAKVRIKVMGFMSSEVLVEFGLVFLARRPELEHLVERERQEREIERPAERIEDAADDPGEEHDVGEPVGETADRHDRMSLPVTTTMAAPRRA